MAGWRVGTLLLCLSFASLVLSQSSTIIGQGSIDFTDLTELYTQVVATNLALEYTESGYTQSVSNLDLARVDYLITQNPLPPSEHTASTCSGVYDLHEVPLNVDGIVIVYTIPGIDTLNPSIPKLILDRSTIVDIYTGAITLWNDPKIVALNPLLASQLPAATFDVYYMEDSTMSQVFSNALSSFSSVWANAQASAGPNGWPFIATGIPNADGSAPETMQARVLAGSSIGFLEYSASTALTNVAQFKNRAGTILKPTTTTMSNAVKDFLPQVLSSLNRTNADPYLYPAQSLLNIVDGPGTSSWPFAHFHILTTRTNSNQDCLKATNTYQLLNFIVTSSAVSQLWTQNSRALLPGEIISALSSLISKMTCCQSVTGGGATKRNVNGQGTDFTSPALSKLNALYTNFAPIQINLALATAVNALSAVDSNTADFAYTVDYPVSATGRHTVPLVGGAVIAVYNIAERPSVVLSMTQIASIFQHTVTTWSAIDPALPNRPINLVLTADSDVAAIFYRGVGSSSGYSFTSGTETATLSLVNSTADSIGLVSLSSDIAMWIAVQTAAMVNLAGNTVQANQTTMLAALNQSDFTVSPTNGPADLGWPLASYVYVTFKSDSSSFCSTLEDLAAFIYWVYTDQQATSSAQSSSVVILTPIAAQIANLLSKVNCGGKAIITPRLTLNGGGSTFAAGVYQSWINAYAFVDENVQITYAGVGSGGGINGITGGTYIWAGSDAVLTSTQITAGKDLQLFPAFAGSVVLAYRIDALGKTSPPLNLTRQVIVDIYLGNIKNWNDPAIQALNPQVRDILPNAPIVLVYRSDSSGTTNIFSSALKSFSPSWTVNPGTTVSWPVSGITGSGSSGVGLRIFSTANSLGYVELTYASANGLSYATIQNKAGFFVTPSQASVRSAMNDFKDSFQPDLTCSIVDAPGEKSWPISAYTYLVLHMTTMESLVSAQKLLAFIQWGLTSNVAADRADGLGFSTLPEDFVDDIVMPRLRQVKVNGVSVLGELPTSTSNDKVNLGLALGIALGIGIPLIALVVGLAWYSLRVRRRKFNPDFFNIEATEWDDSGEKAIEMQSYNDTLGVQLGTPGQPLLNFGVPKGARYPVNVQLMERITLTNNSATDKNFAFYVPRDDSRFKLVLVPGYGVIKPGESTQIEVRFTLLMTTSINRKIKFEVLGAGEQIIPLVVSGDVSTRLDPNEIDILGKPIGQGAFGTVYRGTYRGTQVAVKVLARQNELLKAQTEEFLKEIDLMHKLRSPFIVNFIGASYVPGKLCVVTEFMEKGSVAHILQKLKLEHVLRLKIAYDCAQAMAFLHNNGVMHRDLKPANLLVLSLSSSAEVSVKLADFGTSRTVTQIYQMGRYTNGWGTPGYMAPELLARGEYSGKVDVYAFGILLLELYIQKDPFSFLKKVWDLPEIVLRGNRPEIPAECPPEYSAIITQCWAHLPENRPSFPDLVELLGPLYQAERTRTKENKRRIAETGGAAPSKYQPLEGGSNASGSDYHSNAHSNTHSNTNLSNTNHSNTTSTGLLHLQQSGGFQQSGAFHNYYSNTMSNSNDPNNRSGAGTPKGKERVTEGPEDASRVPVTSLANLSNDFIDQDRRDMFESERKPNKV